MENYASNSHRSKERQNATPDKKVEKVVQGAVKTRKKSNTQRLLDTFISEDLSNVRDYVVLDVIVPLIKKAAYEGLTKTLDMVLYGETNRSTKSSPASRVSYGRCYGKDERAKPQPRTRNAYEYDDIVFETRGDAEDVLSRMDEIIALYGIANLADLCDMSGMDTRWTDNKYGWTDIRHANIERTREGYIIKFPKISPLN